VPVNYVSVTVATEAITKATEKLCTIVLFIILAIIILAKNSAALPTNDDRYFSLYS